MLHIYYGTGKGKTTASIGLATRLLGVKKKVLVIQFLKDGTSSEIVSLKKLGATIEYLKMPSMFVDMNDPDMVKEVKAMQLSLFNKIDDSYDGIILDELLDVLTLSLLNEADVIKLISDLKKQSEVVVTGRKPPIGLSKIADYMTEMKKIKHPYDHGVLARKGIEY